jgi:putative transcriptional regulator
MGEKKLRVADVQRATGLNRSTITALYYENAMRVDLKTMNDLCVLLDCSMADLFEYCKSDIAR